MEFSPRFIENIFDSLQEPYMIDRAIKLFDKIPVNIRWGIIKNLSENCPKIAFVLGEYLSINGYYSAALGSFLCDYYNNVPTLVCLETIKTVIIKILESNDKSGIRIYWDFINAIVPDYINLLCKNNKIYKIIFDMAYAETIICRMSTEIQVLRMDISDLRNIYLSLKDDKLH